MKDKLISITEACEILNVSKDTLRRWDANSTFPAQKTEGKHRKYLLSEVNKKAGIIFNLEDGSSTTVSNDDVAVYCRVSSHDQKQKGDLERQKARVMQYCVDKGYRIVECFDETGSGMNDNRAKLHKLINLAISGKIKKVVVEHSDRLTRFNYKLVEVLFNSHGVKVECIEEVLGKTFEDELVKDMLTLMASFSAKIYGKRSHQNRKKKEAEAPKEPEV
jgi:excisionase family DNA binding protein